MKTGAAVLCTLYINCIGGANAFLSSSRHHPCVHPPSRQPSSLTSHFGPLEWDSVQRGREQAQSRSSYSRDEEEDIESVDTVLQRYWQRCRAERGLFGWAEELPEPPIEFERKGIKRAQVLQAKFADPEAKKEILEKRKEATKRRKRSTISSKSSASTEKVSKQSEKQRAANALRAEMLRLKARDSEEWARRRLASGPGGSTGNEAAWDGLSLTDSLVASRRKKQQSYAKAAEKRAIKRLEKQQRENKTEEDEDEGSSITKDGDKEGGE